MKKRLVSFLHKVARRQHNKSWAASFAVIAIGAIAITLLSGFLSNAASLDNRISGTITNSNAPDIYVTTDPRKGFNLNEIADLKNAIPDISEAEGRFYTFCNMSSRDAIASIEPSLPNYSKPYEYVKKSSEQTDSHYFIIDDFLTTDLSSDNQNKLVVGGDAIISIPLASFNIDETTIAMTDFLLKKGKENPLKKENLELKFTITGTMKHLECSARGAFMPTVFLTSNSYFRDVLRSTFEESFTELGVRLIWQKGFQEKVGWGDGNPYGKTDSFPLANQFLLKLKDPAKTTEVKKAVEDYYAAKTTNNLYLAQALSELTAVKTLETEKSQAWQLTFVFPIVFFAVALLVSLISVRQTIIHERLDIGTYKALGLTKFEIRCHYIYKSMLLAFIGVLAGEIVGPLLVPAVLGSKYNLLYSLPNRTYTFPILPCLAVALVYLGLTALVTFCVSRREINLKPAESMRPEPPEKKTKKVIHSKRSSWVQLSLKLAGRSIKGDPVKTGMVVIGVLGCTALLCCGYGIEDTIRYGVDTDPLIVSGANLTVFLSDSRPESTIAQEFDIIGPDGNKIINGYQPFYRESLNVVASSNTYYTNLHLIGDYKLEAGTRQENHFKYNLPLDQILISDKIARQLGVKAGDKVTFAVAGYEVSAPIAQTIPVFYENGIYMRSDSPLLGKPTEAYNCFWVDTINSSDQNAAEEAIRKIRGVAMCDSEVSWRKRIEDAMGSILVMTNAIKVFAFLLAAVVLYDLGLLNFSERQREIATMKVLGFKQMEIMNSLLVETMSLTIIGILGGLALGFPFTKLVLYINQVELVDYLYTVKPLSYGIAFGFTFVLALAINLLLSFRVRKIMAVESLKSVE